MWAWKAALICVCFLRSDREATAVGVRGRTREELSFAQMLTTAPAEEPPCEFETETLVRVDGVPERRISPTLQTSSPLRLSATGTSTASSARRVISGDRRELEDSMEDSSLVGSIKGTPEVDVSMNGAPGRGQPPNEEQEEERGHERKVGEEGGGPGARIEKMGEHWTQHASAPPLAGAVLENVRAVYTEISHDILTRWGYKYANTPLFSGGIHFSDGGAVVENKMLDAVVEQRGFLAAFTGVSTTAGHDCLYEQSYPIVLNGTMGRLMAAAGVRFEAINVAMGNTRVAPYSFCVDAHAGLDADLISWDMTMMVASNQCGRSSTSVELFIRSATVLPKRPAILLTDASPNQELCTSGHLPQIEKQDHGLMGSCIPSRNLAEVYGEFGLHQFSPRSLVPELTCGDEAFARQRLYNNTEKDTPRPVGWHTGPTGHLLLADMLFMNYGEVFLRAMERLEGVLPGVTAAGLRKPDVLLSNGRDALRESLGLAPGAEVPYAPGGGESARGSGDGDVAAYMGGGRGVVLPAPVWCKGWRFCDWAGSYRCANTYFPLAGSDGSRLLDMVSESTPAVANRDRSEYFVDPPVGRWAVTLNEEARFIKEYLTTVPPEGFHHPIDLKWVLVGNKDSGPIEFEFETIGVTLGGRRQRRRERRRRRTASVEQEEEGEEEEEVEEEEDEEEDDERGEVNTGVESGGREQLIRPRYNQGGFSDKVDRIVDDGVAGRMARATRVTMAEAEQFDSRVTVCKPDFIDRVGFNETSEVRFSIDGFQVPVVELVQIGLYPGSCVVLDAQVGAGHHTLKVEPLREGETYVAISHVLYPA